MHANATIFSSGEASSKRVRRRSLIDSADVIKAAGESSQTDPTAFIEKQRQILNEVESSRQTGSRVSDGRYEVVMQDEDRTGIATKLEFEEGHYRSTSPKNSVGDNKPITTQPGFADFSSQENAMDYSEYVQIDDHEYEKLIDKHASAIGGKCEILHCDWLPHCAPPENISQKHIINLLLTKLVQSRLLYIGLVLFYKFTGLDSVSVH